ncbi:MAG: 16S rRNA (guanine(527)-N(7))-methyltransferase RsmG [Rhodospirillaceae bacterium]|nr:MAG: 16S rRNA (guanine(527)-N(7))-methyltransferase RsmG [Rhodospirillaceae bacterium]
MKQESYGPEGFQRDTGVSRETLERLKAYAHLLIQWNPKINLVGKSTINELWWRHMLDSAQLYRFLPHPTHALVDMGSGAGFPGLVLAIMGASDAHLIEGDQRKAAFLREAARVAEVKVTVHASRTEGIKALKAGIITARALAPLAELLALAEPFSSHETVHIYLKGQNVEVELTESHKMWTMRLEKFPSRTDQAASILRLSEVRRDGIPHSAVPS